MRWVATALALMLATPAAAQDFAVVHATAWTMAGDAPIDDATVVVRGGHIASVSAHAAPPVGLPVTDVAGAILTPGLVNGASQVGLVEVDSAADSDDRSVASGPLGAAFDVRYALNPASVTVPIVRADGLTAALVYPDRAATAPFAGLAATIRLDGALLERPAAALFVTIGDGTQARAGGSRSAQWQLLRNALDEARAYRASPAPRDQLLARLDAAPLKAVLSGTIPLAVVADRASDLAQALALAADEHVRIVIVGGAEAWQLAPALAAAHIPVVLDPLANLPNDFDRLGSRFDNAALLDAAGVALAFTVSGNTLYRTHNAGLGLREGAGIAVANGLPYARALRAVTSGGAAIWGMAPATLAPGSVADMVLWDGDPLEVTSAPRAVWIGGRAQSLTTRQTLLRDRYAPSRADDPLPPAYR